MTKRIVLLQALASTLKDMAYILDEPGLAGAGNGAGETAELGSAELRSAESWTIQEVLTHLVYVEGANHVRFQRIIDETNPTVPEIRPDDTPFDETSSTAEQLTQFKVARAKTIMMLKALSPGQWQRPAVHATMGKTTLRFMVQLLIEHDIEHLNQMVELQQAERTVPVRNAQPAVRKGNNER